MTTERAASSTGQTPSSVGHEHGNVTGGWLRPAVFGAMDGLVSNFALIAGVAGGSDDRQVIVLAGLAGLAAGAFSMAAGEYTSVAAQAEHAEAEIAIEREELRTNPHGEERELAALYAAKGLDPQLAATSSFLSFAAGAVIPVLPYLLGSRALWPAVVMALLGLFLCGAVVTR